MPSCTYGAWPYDGTNLSIYYQYGGGHRYIGNVYQGGVNWSAAGTKVKVSQWPGVPYALQVPIKDLNSKKQTWWGLTDWSTSGTTITNAPVYLNQHTMDPLGDFMRTKVATHELGHALGLLHPKGCGTSTKSIMNQGELSYNKPQSYDKDKLQGLHP